MIRSLRNRWPIMFVGLACLLCSGCVSKSSAAGMPDEYTYQPWVGLGVMFGGVTVVVIGWLMRNSSPGRALGMMLAGCFLGLGLAPGPFRDRLLVDNEHFEMPSGLWFFGAYHDVKFSYLQNITVDKRYRSSRHGSRTKKVLVCTYHNGQTEEVPVNELLEAALDDVLARAQARGLGIRHSGGGCRSPSIQKASPPAKWQIQSNPLAG